MKTLSEITEQEIRELPAGKQLDALVNETMKYCVGATSYAYSTTHQHVGEMLEWLASVVGEYRLTKLIDRDGHFIRWRNKDDPSWVNLTYRPSLSYTCATVVAIVGKRRLNNENVK